MDQGLVQLVIKHVFFYYRGLVLQKMCEYGLFLKFSNVVLDRSRLILTVYKYLNILEVKLFGFGAARGIQ